jgi:2-phosphosulfolactate phosphatase
MKASVFFSPSEMKEESVRARTVIVLDVLRASTTIVTALANGARGVIPADSLESATEMVMKLGPDDVLLCAERDRRRVEGCDLGNSPAEYDQSRVSGRLLVLSTTNGARTVLKARWAGRLLVGAYVNASRVVEALARDAEVVFLCAGDEGGFALEDAACAGYLLHRLAEHTGNEIEPANDGAWVAQQLGKRAPKSPLSLLRRSSSGRKLEKVGLGDDLALCAAVDAFSVLPVLRDYVIVRSE